MGERTGKVISQVSAVSDDFAQLKRQLSESAAVAKSLSEAVSRLKKNEKDIEARLDGVDKKATKAEPAPRRGMQ